MAENKGPPHSPPLIPRPLRDLHQSPLCQPQHKTLPKLRESLPQPQDTPQQLKTPRLPADPVVDAIALRVRAEKSWERELEPAPEQAKLRQIESEYVDWMEVLSRQV